LIEHIETDPGYWKEKEDEWAEVDWLQRTQSTSWYEEQAQMVVELNGTDHDSDRNRHKPCLSSQVQHRINNFPTTKHEACRGSNAESIPVFHKLPMRRQPFAPYLPLARAQPPVSFNPQKPPIILSVLSALSSAHPLSSLKFPIFINPFPTLFQEKVLNPAKCLTFVAVGKRFKCLCSTLLVSGYSDHSPHLQTNARGFRAYTDVPRR
jgi:hypothetical protein